jgi:hypothetical protein
MRARALLAALLLVTGAARGDGVWLRELRDERGRVVAAVPRAHTAIAMRGETVAIVPYEAGGDVMLFVNVRYVFANPGAAADLLVGFPEMRARRLEHHCGYICDDDRVVATPSTIESFAADSGGRALAVRTLPGSEDYARWFVFSVGFGAGETRVRNLYSAHAGSTRSETNTSSALSYRAEYVLHTGSEWAGAIGAGDIFLMDGAWQHLRHFADLRPTRRDDVAATLQVAVQPSAGRPLLLWDYGNGQQGESTPPRLEISSVARHSSARADDAAGVAHLGAMALDGDATTAWIDAGTHGAVGEWLQVPTHRQGRLRGLSLRAGEPSAGLARPRRLRLTCFDLEGNDLEPAELERAEIDLEDTGDEQRVVFPRPLGACHAVRLTLEALHGPATAHSAVAEVRLLE